MSKLFVNTIQPTSGDTVTVSGSLTTTGKLIIGDQTSDTVVLTAEVSSSIIPDATNTYDLGSPTKVWKEIYVSSESLNFVDGAGSSSKFTKENVDDFKAGKSSATIGSFANSTRAKAIFQDDDTTTYKKMTVKGRVSQFISGVLVKDYNKSGSNSYSKKDGIQTYEWNGADSMSFNSTHSFWNVENMMMDLPAEGFFGLAVSGSTAASNNHNMANNISGLFLTGSNVIISGSNISLSGSFTQSGDFNVTESQVTLDTTLLQVTGSTSFNGNTEISGAFSQSGEAVLDGGTTFIMGATSESISSGATVSESIAGGLVVSSAPGTSGSSQDGSTGGVIIAEQVVAAPNLINRAIVTSSLTLTIAEHGNGKKVYIRSGSTPREGLETSTNLSPGLPYYALPSQPQSVPPIGIDGHENSDHPNGDHDLCGAYLRRASDGPAGTLRIELPSASVGEVIYFQSMQFQHG